MRDGRERHSPQKNNGSARPTVPRDKVRDSTLGAMTLQRRGYSADFFDGEHFVMKGGSSRTAACMLRPTFRNWFQSHYQYVYAGFRCTNQ